MRREQQSKIYAELFTDNPPPPTQLAQTELPFTKAVQIREKPLTNRFSILHSSSKKDYADVLAMLADLKKNEFTQQRDQSRQERKLPDRYNVHPEEYMQERLMREAGEMNLNLNTRGSLIPGTGSSMLSSAQPHSPPHPAPATASHSASSTDTRRGATSSRAPTSAPADQRRSHPPKPRQLAQPIILVPGAFTALITLYNAKEFLENGTFVPTEEKKKGGMTKPPFVEVVRRSCQNPEKTVTYQVYDSAVKLSPNDWKRVAAVFAQGVQWQFRSYRWPDPAELFSRVRGFHLCFEDKIEPAVLNWNVTVLKISRSKRYMDPTVARDFWSAVEQFIQRHKPHLAC